MAKSYYHKKIILEYCVDYEEAYNEILAELDEDEKEDVSCIVDYFTEIWIVDYCFNCLDEIETSAAYEYEVIDTMTKEFREYCEEKIKNKEIEVENEQN